jgi:DNA-binding NtrC family response regulator
MTHDMLRATQLEPWSNGIAAPSQTPEPEFKLWDSDMEWPRDTLQLLGAKGHVRRLEAIEGEAIRFAISHYKGQMSEVARRLGIGRSTLYRKLDTLGIPVNGAVRTLSKRVFSVSPGPPRTIPAE